MSQIPASILILAASVFSLAAHSAAAGSPTAVMTTLAAIAIGVWGTVSLVTATLRERELLVDSQAKLDLLDQILDRDPLRTLSTAVPNTVDRRPSAPPQTVRLSNEVQDQLANVAHLSGRDQNEIVEEAIQQNLNTARHARVA